MYKWKEITLEILYLYAGDSSDRISFLHIKYVEKEPHGKVLTEKRNTAHIIIYSAFLELDHSQFVANYKG